MSFITEQQAIDLIGSDFENASDKARLILLANTWVKNKVGFVPSEIDETLTIAASEIIRGIQAGALYAGVERQTVSESVSAGSGVTVSETFAEGSVALSQYEQVAMDLIAALDLKNPNKSNGFGFEVYR